MLAAASETGTALPTTTVEVVTVKAAFEATSEDGDEVSTEAGALEVVPKVKVKRQRPRK